VLAKLSVKQSVSVFTIKITITLPFVLRSLKCPQPEYLAGSVTDIEKMSVL